MRPNPARYADHTGNTGLVFPIVVGAGVASALRASLIRR